MKRNSSAFNRMTESNKTLINISMLILRAAIGIILFMVGAGKVLGWFGGSGLHASIQSFGKMGISVPFAYMSCFTEFIGGMLLIIGLITRPAAFAVAINMLVAFYIMLPRGFISGGAAYPFSLLIIAVAVLLTGPMEYSLDFLIFSHRADNFLDN